MTPSSYLHPSSLPARAPFTRPGSQLLSRPRALTAARTGADFARGAGTTPCQHRCGNAPPRAPSLADPTVGVGGGLTEGVSTWTPPTRRRRTRSGRTSKKGDHQTPTDRSVGPNFGSTAIDVDERRVLWPGWMPRLFCCSRRVHPEVSRSLRGRSSQVKGAFGVASRWRCAPTLDLRASATPPGSVVGRPWPALHIARRPR
jgi:hypothetical protein